jgi:hypothetical protein
MASALWISSSFGSFLLDTPAEKIEMGFHLIPKFLCPFRFALGGSLLSPFER